MDNLTLRNHDGESHGSSHEGAPWGDSSYGKIAAVGDLGTLPYGLSNGGTSNNTTTVTINVGGGGTTSTSPAPTVVTLAGSGLVFDLNWDSSVGSAPAAFVSDVIAAAQYLESQITTGATISMDVGYGEVDGYGVGSALGESESNIVSVSYSNLIAALQANPGDATSKSVLASLPATSPVNGTIWLTIAQAEALGLEPVNGSQLAGEIGFNTSSDFTYGDTNTSGSVASGTYDFFSTVVHEMTEVMGRVMAVGESVEGTTGYTLMDLLHYSASGVRDLVQSTPGYFSANGGATSLGALNTISGGDPGDWASSVVNDPFDAYASPGVLEKVSAADLTEMNALGWAVAGSTVTTPPATPPATSAPSGVVVAPDTSTLVSGLGQNCITANSPIAGLAEAGGKAGDSFTYTLGGANAGSFKLTAASNGVELSAAGAKVMGAANGKLYALNVTVNDTTAGVSSAAIPLNVVVGTAGNDAINLASLSGITPAAPTFIYGLAGTDTINGTGMTGTLFFDGGAGVDTMTGGSGANIYEYGSVADSTPSLMDVITNFNTSHDLINLTGLGGNFNTPAALGSATSIGADSIGWASSGGNTFVYVNDTSSSLTLAKASMKIELNGNVALGSSNFAYA